MSRLKQLIQEVHRRSLWHVLAGFLVLSCVGCESGPAPLTAERPLHLDAATIERSEVCYRAAADLHRVHTLQEDVVGWEDCFSY